MGMVTIQAVSTNQTFTRRIDGAANGTILIDNNDWDSNRLPDHRYYEQYRIYEKENKNGTFVFVLVDESSTSNPMQYDHVVSTFKNYDDASAKRRELLDY